MTKPPSRRVFPAFLCVRKETPLSAVALATLLSLTPFLQSRVEADSPANSPAAPNEAPAKPTPPANASADKTPEGHADSTATSSVTVEARPAPSRSETRGQYLARTALAYRGAPYRFGGRSPRSGFDCSGLVQAVCSKWGILLPRAASSQIGKGKSVPKDKLLPGDLVFFKNTYKRGISHVGIYVGNNLFVHASRPGVGVVLSRLDKGYHKQHYAGARRLDLSKLPPAPGEEKPVAKVILDDVADIVPGTPETSPQAAH